MEIRRGRISIDSNMLNVRMYQGHSTGDDEFRETFGKTRAETVRARLVEDGIAGDDLVTHAADPEDDLDAAAEWPSQRRVDIRVATRHAK